MHPLPTTNNPPAACLLQENGVTDLPVEVRSVDPGSGRPFDMVVTKRHVKAGEVR